MQETINELLLKLKEGTQRVITLVSNNPKYLPIMPVEDSTIYCVDESGGMELAEVIFTNPAKRLSIAIDIETNGLDPYRNDILLISLKVDKYIFVIDACTVNNERVKTFLTDLNQNAYWIGQGLKFEQGFFKVKYGIFLNKVFDTMITDQRLYQNMNLKADLGALCAKYLNVHSKFMSTDEYQLSFVGLKKTPQLTFTREQIYYSGMDVVYPIEIAKQQVNLVNVYGMQRLIYEVESPLIEVLSSMELYGSRLDTSLLRKIVSENETKLAQVELELDDLLRDLIKIKVKEGKIIPRIPKLDKHRSKAKSIQTTFLFDDSFSDVEIDDKSAINYSSTPQIVKVFAELNEVLPVKKGSPDIPTVDVHGNVEQTGFSTEEKILEEFILEYPNLITIPFFKKLFEYRETRTELNKYNEKFISTINPLTGRIHTKYKQCDNDNSRLGSGGGKKEPDKFNSQNVPRKEVLRNMFLANKDEYLTLTIDLAGAEVTIMASKAGDKKLFDLYKNNDIHSYMATKGWRAIYNLRAKNLRPLVDAGKGNPETLKDYEDKALNFLITKKNENGELRQKGKNLTFGSIYGVGAKKGGKTINVPKEEGGAYVGAIRTEVPTTMKMIRSNIEFAMRNGYLIINPVNNSRCWFPGVISCLKEGLDYEEYKQIESLSYKVNGQAANIPISGTQADMLKEAMVNIYKYFKAENLEAFLKFSVHDELVIDFHKKYLDWLPEKIKQILVDTCNIHLSEIKMDAEYHIAPYWVKDPPKPKQNV